MLALIEQTAISGIAGWLTYLEKEKGVVAGAGHEIKDDETMGATPPASTARQRRGRRQRVTQQRRSWRRHCGPLDLDAGMWLELTCNSQRLHWLDCFVNAPKWPGLIWLGGDCDSGMKTETKKCAIVYADYAEIDP